MNLDLDHPELRAIVHIAYDMVRKEFMKEFPADNVAGYTLLPAKEYPKLGVRLVFGDYYRPRTELNYGPLSNIPLPTTPGDIENTWRELFRNASKQG